MADIPLPEPARVAPVLGVIQNVYTAEQMRAYAAADNAALRAELANARAADPAAPAVNCEWTNCPRRVGDVCCNDRPAAPAVPAVDCRTCGRHNACVNTYDEDQDCFKADRYQPLPPVKLWRAA